MEPILLFGFQFTLTFIAFAIIAKWYVVPRLAALPLEVALMPLIWVHAFRSIGLTILAPGTVDANVPADFRAMIGYGDLAAAILALLALVALHAGAKGAIALIWVFNIVGVLDLVNAVIQGLRYDVFNYSLGAGWLIVTFYVPALWVSSLIIFYFLLKRKGSSA